MDVDLTELDDWLGTLEELQLGLEPIRQVPANVPSSGWLDNSSKSHLKHTSVNTPKSPLRTAKTPSSQGLTNPSTLITPAWVSPFGKHSEDFNKTAGYGVKSKEESAEGDLSSLLRELEVVEERMRVLEQEDNANIQRYGLSPLAVTTTATTQSRLVAQTQLSNNPHNYHQPKQLLINGIASASPRNGLVSAKWASLLNPATAPQLCFQEADMDKPQTFLRSGCLPSDSSINPHTHIKDVSTTPVKASEASWTSPRVEGCLSLADPEKSASASQTTLVNAPINACASVTHSLPPVELKEEFIPGKIPPPTPPMRYSTKPTFQENNSDHQSPIGQLHVFQETGVPSLVRSDQKRSSPLPASPSPNRAHPPLIDHFSTGSSQPSPQVTHKHVSRSSGDLKPMHFTSPVDINGSIRAPLTGKNLSVMNREELLQTRSPQQRSGTNNFKGEVCNHSREAALPSVGGDGMSTSLSPDSSLSERSLSDMTDFSRRSDFSADSNNLRKPIFVRVFRHDRTTKAVLVEEHTTAGEVASMLIEKNFMQPSTSLVLVEKVPSMKVERIFEEHQQVSDCILSWSTRSQNMIFFEERPEHFGFIEVPANWLGEGFVQKHGYQSSEAMQASLNNLDKVGFPEYRDYLYIRKPGEKTWSRRLCVLRNSGLYTSNKNKKPLNATDLIRILILDSQLQLYTTTGGWSRMRAPTPHGFAFKPYSANDLSSTHVFCFCATDERALRQWVCRLRIAKYGRQLLTDYQTATSRVQRLTSIRHGSIGSSLLCLSASPMSVQLHRKSTIDVLCPSQTALSAAESTSSLTSNLDSPSLIQRFYPEQAQSVNLSNGDLPNKRVTCNEMECQSPRLLRSHHSTNGIRNSAEYTSMADKSISPLQSVTQGNLSDTKQEVSHTYRLEKQAHSPTPYNSKNLMNGNHLLPSGIARPRV